MTKQKQTLPNSNFTAEEMLEIRKDILENYSPALRNSKTFREKYGLSTQRINEIYHDEIKKHGIEIPERKVDDLSETLVVSVPAGTNEALQKIAHRKWISKPSLVRGLISDLIKNNS